MHVTVILIVTGLFIFYFVVNIMYDLFSISTIEKSEEGEVIDLGYLSEEPIIAGNIVKEQMIKREQELKEEEAQRIEARDRLNAEEAKRKEAEEVKSKQTLDESLKALRSAQELEAKEKEEREMLEAANIAEQGHIANVTSSEGRSLKSIVEEAYTESSSNIFANFRIYGA